MAHDPEQIAHKEWLGYVQPVGLVVSPPALLAAQAHVNRNIVPQQEILKSLVRLKKLAVDSDGHREEVPAIPDLPEFCLKFFGWEHADLVGSPGAGELPESLT